MVYSFALALIVGLIFVHYTGRDPSWVILLMTIVPDTDFVLNRIMAFCGLSSPYILNHGDFHNLLSLLFFSIVAALLLHKYGKMHFGDALLCSMIGFAAHLAEDFIVYASWYGYLYPWSLREYGVSILPETRNLYGFADSKILALGLILVCIALFIRVYFDRTYTIGSWIRKYTHIGQRVKYHTGTFLSVVSERLGRNEL
jgi:membrane-bound metal-dependent hydrolase YbcI (DUF457 family)